MKWEELQRFLLAFLVGLWFTSGLYDLTSHRWWMWGVDWTIALTFGLIYFQPARIEWWGLRAKRRLGCLFGHQWRITHLDKLRMSSLGHLSTMAGVRAECVRCGETWDDLSSEARAFFRKRDEKEGRIWFN